MSTLHSAPSADWKLPDAYLQPLITSLRSFTSGGVCPSERYIVAGREDGKVYIKDMEENGEEGCGKAKMLEGGRDFGGEIRVVRFAPEKVRFVLG